MYDDLITGARTREGESATFSIIIGLHRMFVSLPTYDINRKVKTRYHGIFYLWS